MGFEPMIRVLQTLALASWPRRLARSILSKSRGMVKQNDLSGFKLGRCKSGGSGTRPYKFYERRRASAARAWASRPSMRAMTEEV